MRMRSSWRMFSLSQFYNSHILCDAMGSSNNTTGISLAWDRGVALLVGSLEGHREGGAPLSDGTLMYNLANEQCSRFGTCDESGRAKIIAEYARAFNSGRDAGVDGRCGEILASADEISRVVMLPVMQGVLKCAVENEGKPADTASETVASGEAFAMALLPIAKKYSEDSSQTLERNMIIRPREAPVVDGAQRVADAV